MTVNARSILALVCHGFEIHVASVWSVGSRIALAMARAKVDHHDAMTEDIGVNHDVVRVQVAVCASFSVDVLEDIHERPDSKRALLKCQLDAILPKLGERRSMVVRANVVRVRADDPSFIDGWQASMGQRVEYLDFFLNGVPDPLAFVGVENVRANRLKAI